MEGRSTCGLWTVVFLLGCGRLSAFNLDTENVLKKTGERGSLFGFSLAMHRQLDPQDKRMLLVGAPTAKKLSRQISKVTGGLYKCGVTSDSLNCERVDFDNEENEETESKENQWMGVTVNSQGPGGKVVTCAHRYKQRARVNTDLESRDIIGRCYVLSQSLTIDPRLNEEGGSWHFCESRPRGHEMFGSCQQGLSATFDKDYHYLIFGAPGAYSWKGIVRLEQKNESLVEMGIFDDGPFEVGDENEKDPSLVPVPPNSYLGFALDSGNNLSKEDQLTVVAGAPRANHSGSVVLLKKGDDTSRVLLEEFTLEGEGLASSFGYDLAVLNLNGDKWLDIVVGAPQYFEKDGKIGGAVYVYVNKAGKWNTVTPTRIDGPQDSMFGLAVENLGDLNKDGYQDFAVGAPYDDNGAGNVYIYHGSAKGLSSKKASQVLSGQSLGVTLFGYSLAGNMDLDKNSYLDLAVGSLSDSVFVFRTRPVINVKKEITFMPNQIDFTKKNCGVHFCLEVQACFTVTAKNYAKSLTLVYTLEADAEQRSKGLTPRATFSEPSANAYESKGTVTLDMKGKKQCIKRQLQIKDDIQDKLHGIGIDVSVEIQEGNRKRRQSSSSQIPPVLDANELKTAKSLVNFLKEGCGSDNVCQSNLELTYRYGYKASEEDAFAPLEMEGGVPVYTLSDEKGLALEVKVSNLNGDDAHSAFVVAGFPRALTYSSFHNAPAALQVSCKANKNGSRADCELGNPFKRNSETTFYIILSTSGFSANNTELEIALQLETTSDQKIPPLIAKLKVVVALQLSLTGQVQPSQLYFAGKVKSESDMKVESDIGTAITHQFRIINLGKQNFGTATLEIHWPKVISKGKWLLYLMDISSTGVKQMECSPKAEVNPLNLATTTSRRRRAAESTAGGDKGTLSRLIDRKKFKTLTCDNGAKCVIINCPLKDLESHAVFTLKSRLWNGTFIESFPKLHHVEVMVKAFLRVDGAKNQVLKNAETQVMLTVFPVSVQAQLGGVPWWIIVLTILFALLLLALLAFLLWKRAYHEDGVPSYSAVCIKREERVRNTRNDGNWEILEEKQPWMKTWHDKEHY